MGARPVALLDGLRFAEPDWHFSRAVGGIGHYGNCVGVPTVGGEVVFDEAYRDNCLVNAMCVGLLPSDRVTRAKATGSGQSILLYGATTGRDGIGGASVLASQELDDAASEKRPSVQIGDPFTGKKLIEASVEIVQAGLVESLQDCGAAGIASALSEMAAEFGIDVHLDRVPLREEGMEPWEVMISESQERMVAIVRPQMVEAVEAVLDRWELHHAVIGEVTSSRDLRAFWHGDVVGEIPARLLTDECPRYEVAQEPRAAGAPRRDRRPPSTAEALLQLLASPALASREPVYRRYDQLVGSRTIRRPGLDAAVLRLRPSYRGLAHARRPGAARRTRPLPRRRARDPRGGTKRRLCRRRAARLHRLPELRQPGEAGDRVGARPGHRGHCLCLRRARAAHRLRERLALQRDERPRDPPDARRRRRRSRPRRAPRAAGLARRRPAVRRGGLGAHPRGLRVPGAVR